MTDKSWMECLVVQLENGSISEAEYQNELHIHSEKGCPVEVTASTRLGDEVRALKSLFDSESVPETNLRSKNVVTVIYGFARPGQAWAQPLHAARGSPLELECGVQMKATSPQTGGSLRTSWNLLKTKSSLAT